MALITRFRFYFANAFDLMLYCFVPVSCFSE